MRILLLPLFVAAAVVSMNGCQRSSSTAACADCNVLLITMDTVRADHLPCYGYGIDTAPNVCGLAEEGALSPTRLASRPGPWPPTPLF